MSLCVSNILGKKKLKKLLHMSARDELQYSNLVLLYQNLDKKTREMIRESTTSFLDILIDCRFPDSDSSKIESVRTAIYGALIQKIRVGLIALNASPLTKISTQILQLGSNFASDDLIRRVCCSNSRYFVVKQSEKDSIVHIAPTKVTRGAEENEKPSTSKSHDESRAQKFIKYFYKSRPDLINALDCNALFKDILVLYDFWEKQVSRENTGDFIDWLLTLAKVKSPESYAEYKLNLNTHLGNRIIGFIQPCARTIAQIFENICIGRKYFLTQKGILGVVLANPTQMFITKDTNKLPLAQQLVKAKSVKANDLDPPDQLEARVKPLLTLRASYSTVLSTFKIVYQSPWQRAIVAKCGCFLNYLVQYGKLQKEKLSTEEFTHHLYSFVKPFLLSVLNGTGVKDSNKSIIDNVMDCAPEGLIDAMFVRDAALFYSTDFAATPHNDITVLGTLKPEESSSSGEETPPQGEEPPPPGEEPNSSQEKEDPMSGLESSQILHLVSKHPQFSEILEVFGTLPETAIAVLANSSMSFFEWLIALSKRLMPHDASILESHLQRIIQVEVARLHSRQHCQMTVQHVHCLLCAGQPMLLSPNFLSWCLERPDSSFSVFQSWIYLKNQRSKMDSTEQPSTGKENSPTQKKEYNLEYLLRVVPDCNRLSDLIRVIRAIPTDQVNFLLQNSSSWYDFLENNLRHKKFRELLASLLAEEAKVHLEDRMLKISDLVVLLSDGISNFVSEDCLVDVLRYHRDIFALPDRGSGNFKVGTVRQMEGDQVTFANNEEEGLLRQILLYFPSSGFCDVSTIVSLIRKEDSYLHKGNELIDDDYLRCFFQMFPMLFYLRVGKVVLTCMALDKKGAYRNALCPTTGAGVSNSESSNRDVFRNSPRKRSRSHRHASSSKRKRRRSSRGRQSSSEKDDCNMDVVVIADSSEEENHPTVSRVQNEVENTLVMDEGDECDSLRNVIDRLPVGLVTDITTSLLLRSGGGHPTNPLLKELLFATAGADESQLIQSSEKLFSLFKKKIFAVLRKNDSKFLLVKSSTDPFNVIEIKMVDVEQDSSEKSTDGHQQAASKTETKEPQVEEVSSTSLSPVRPCTPPTSPPVSPASCGSTEISIHRSVEDDVIKLPAASFGPPNPVRAPEVKDTKEKKAEEKQSIRCKILSPVSEENSSTPNLNDKPIPPSYSTISACNAYAKEPLDVQTAKHDSKMYRERLLTDFFKSYLNINAGSCATELLVSSAYRRFQDERFARSALAFEAYLYDFALKHRHAFVFSGTLGEFGVSKILYRRGGSPSTSPQNDNPANLNFLKLEHEVCTSCCAYLSTKPHKRAPIKELCATIKDVFKEKLKGFPEVEFDGVIRILVLVSTIRNLAMFCFAVDEASVYLRHHKKREDAPPPSHPHQTEINFLLKNKLVRNAVLLMAKILETSRPGSQTNLRSLWQAEAPPDLAKVFGTGISFTLALRKYSFLFPTSEEGTVSIDAEAMAALRMDK